ncbi:MAG: hypothetical protein H7A47_09920 [Verrucomicrobiales bacterium]|nr:hypothetical protein [Verrucomicrobiales bacterium]
MRLPDYYLADVPDDAALTPAMILDACLTLKSNRRRYLAERTTSDLIEVLARVAGDWLQPDNPFRALALADGPEQTGFSRVTIARGLDELFGSITVASLRALVAQDLGHRHRLDRLVAPEGDDAGDLPGLATAMAVGPEFLVHVTGGMLPNPPITSIVLGLLVRSAQFVKCARGTSFLPRLFAHSVREVDAKLAACLELAEWPGGTEKIEAVLWEQADCVTAMGSDETIASLRRRLPDGVRFLGFGHRASVGFIAQEVMSPRELPRVVAAAAADVTAWDQLGCLSPHAFYVETGGRLGAEKFAEALAAALEAAEVRQPRGPVDALVAADIVSRRAFYEVRAAAGPETRLWQSRESTAWTVVYDADPEFQPSCLHRFVHVKAVGDADAMLPGLERMRGRISTVAVEAPRGKQAELAVRLARRGVPRICPLGRMQQPPLTWRHDARPALGDLITWHECETQGVSPHY